MLKFNVEVITPAVAAEYLKNNENNRKPNKGQVGFYAKMMQNGEWELNGEAIKFAPDGRLLDGQHRLMACVEANVPFETAVIREVEEKVFATFDQGWQRKKGQVFSLANIPNGTNVAAAINKYLVMGQNRITSMESTSTGFAGKSVNYGKRQISAKECLDEYNLNPEYWQELHKLTSVMYRRCRLMPMSDLAAIISHLNLHCKYDLSYVVEFFNQLFYEEQTEMDIIRNLRQRLVRDAMGSLKMKSQMRTQLIRKTWDCYKAGVNPNVLKWTKGVEEEKPFE